jgi:hypothetical protein
MRHLAGIKEEVKGTIPRTLVEIGPGSSLGVGLAALLCGVEKYVALDLQEHRSVEHDREILASLSCLLRDRAPFSAVTLSGDIFFPPPPNADIWAEIAPDMERSLKPETLHELNQELVSGKGARIRFVAPWTDRDVLPGSSIDWIMTHSVMEHVDDLSSAYECMAHWLKVGGYATHLIDFSSHNLTKHWNGHWALGPAAWALIRGRRPYLINRMWRSHHISLMRRHGLELVSETKFERSDGLRRDAFKQPFSGMPPADESTAMSFVVVRRV